MGLTQEDLAERAGLSARGIGDLERGVKTRPRAYTVRQLAEALQLSPDDRTLFERAARAGAAITAADEMPPEGSFLGAVPANELLGREEERERIRSILAAVEEGRGHLLLLGGEVGAGKTRLLQEVTLEARSRGYLVLTGHCTIATQHSPYSPFLEALSELPARVRPGIRAECERAWKRVQRLVSGRTEDGSIADGAVNEQQRCTTISDLVLLAARGAPLAILVDDLHWADDVSLNLLYHLARSTASKPVLLAGSFCDVRLGEQHPHLAQTLVDLSRGRLVERITVRRLSLEETTQLVAATMGQEEVSEEFASFVYRRTKGNPRLIDQLVRSLGGRLELHGEIGAGSMGRVFRALDRTTGTVVAAKLVLARSAIELDALLRWQQEGAVLAKLRHPHIVAVHDTFAEEHATCIIMELLEGRSLGHVLKDGPLPLGRARSLSLQVAKALFYAHTQGIVHRDIKPDNVMVLEGDHVKVTDFGIARILQPDTSLQTIATTGMRMGTPLYMAPEQIEGKTIDGRTDIYAMGAMLYHMVTGRAPFEGGDALAIAVKHLQEQPVPPSQNGPAIPPEWDAVILKAMAKDPVERFQTAAELRETVSRLSNERDLKNARQPERSGDVMPAGARRAWRRFSRAHVATVGVILATVVALVSLVRPPGYSAQAGHHLGRPNAVWGVKMPPNFRFHVPVGIGTGVNGDIFLGDDGSWLTEANFYAARGTYTGILRVSRSGTVLGAWGSHGSGPGQVGVINDIVVDARGIVYIADEQNNRIDRFTADGKALPSIGSAGINPGQFFHPQDVAVDAHGNLYEADNHNDRVQEISPTGQPLKEFGSPGPGRDQLAGPTSVALDRHGDVYVLENTNYRVHEFAPNGRTLAIWGSQGDGPGQFSNPQGIKIDAAGNVYVLDANHSPGIEKFTPNGKLLAEWGSSGTGPGQFYMPVSMTIDSRGFIYIGDFTGRVQKFTSSGKLVGEWRAQDLVRPLFVHPSSVALDRHGDAYVTDAARDEVEKLSPTGALLLHWGRRGNRPGQFKDPSGIAIDPHGNVYVADSGNGRVQDFSSSGVYLSEWRTGAGSQPGRPTGIAVDERGDVYVTDSRSNMVNGYSPQHKLRLTWGDTPSGFDLYQLRSPDGITIDSHGDVYVADAGNHRIVEFAPSDKAVWFAMGPGFSPGRMIRTWNVGAGTKAAKAFRPAGVAIDAKGNIIVTDRSGSSIWVFGSSGKELARWGSVGEAPGQFRDPTGIALDAAGNIYVADSGNARIQRFPSLR